METLGIHVRISILLFFFNINEEGKKKEGKLASFMKKS